MDQMFTSIQGKKFSNFQEKEVRLCVKG